MREPYTAAHLVGDLFEGLALVVFVVAIVLMAMSFGG